MEFVRSLIWTLVVFAGGWLLYTQARSSIVARGKGK